jgi:hypothetical protein
LPLCLILPINLTINAFSLGFTFKQAKWGSMRQSSLRVPSFEQDRRPLVVSGSGTPKSSQHKHIPRHFRDLLKKNHLVNHQDINALQTVDRGRNLEGLSSFWCSRKKNTCTYGRGDELAFSSISCEYHMPRKGDPRGRMVNGHLCT